MAVGDTLLFTLRGAIGETDVLITATEPKFDGASVTVSPEVEVSDASGVGPGVNIRFFRQNADGSFTALYSLKEFPGRTFTPDIGFTEDLQRDQFTIGFTVAVLERDLPDVPDPGSTLTVPSPVPEPDPEPIPPAEGTGQFNVVLPSLPLIGNDPRILASLTIPQIPSIKSAVAETVPSVSEIRGEVDSAIEGPLQRTEDRLEDKIETTVANIDFPEFPEVPTVEEIGAGVETTVLDPIVSDIDSAVTTITDEIGTVVGNVEESLTDTVNDVTTNVETAIEESTDEIDETVTGISGALSTLGDTIGNVSDTVGSIQSDVSDILSAVPEDFETAVQTAIEGIEPTFNESGLFSDPVGFAIGFVQAASDEIVDPEVSQDLQDTLENR